MTSNSGVSLVVNFYTSMCMYLKYFMLFLLTSKGLQYCY